jgi:asparagine synthase (glutamine-hydrolysing)
MCGIAGLYHRDRRVIEDELRVAASVLTHRGPEGTGVHVDGRVGLAHTRLAIIDLAHGGQPLYSPDRALCLIANAEIYNYVELRADLVAKGYAFATHSDCEPLLYAYQEYGDDFLRYVEGMFAFALYDAEREEIILARDRLGIKPLFITVQPEGVYFGSELKSLFRLMGRRPTVNPAGLVQFLQNGFTTGATTICQGIERVLPGEVMRIGAEGIRRRWRYWSLLDAPAQASSYGEAAQRFDALMATVIQQHARSDVPFGLFLSGGVDSSTILALLARYGDHPLRTYTAGFPSSSVPNELADARAFAERCGSQHAGVVIDFPTLLARLPHAIWSADELLSDDATLPVSVLAEKARRDVKVIFSGEGGDEAFAGYRSYGQPRLKSWLKELRSPGSGGFRTKVTFARDEQRSLFAQELLAMDSEWRRPFISHWQETPSSWTDVQRMQYVDINTALPDGLLVKLDRMTMAWGVEGRVPFLDHRVVEFGLGLPDDLKIGRRGRKVFLRRWAEEFLAIDPEHLWRRKRGFAVPMDDCLRGEFLDCLQQVLPEQLGVREWFRPSGVGQLFNEQRRNGRATNRLERLLQFAIWHRLFVEGDGSAPAACEDLLSFLGAKPKVGAVSIAHAK